MHWTQKQLIVMIFFAFTVGVLASALGLGGGVVFNPLLIELGVPPQISSATGMFLVLFASLSNSILYSLAGMMYYRWAIWQGIFTLFGSYAGLKLINDAVKKTGRVSIIVFLLALIIILSAVVIPANSAIDMYYSIQKGDDVFAFSWIC